MWSYQELCDDDPPSITHASFKALAYKEGTMLVCDCEDGFRRLKRESSYMRCTGNSSHSSWDSQCRCASSSPRNTKKQVTAQPRDQKEGKSTEMQSPRQPVDPADLPGHCREPPSWEHEAQERTYQFVVGQTVHYRCDQGYRAVRRGSAQSICEVAHGKTRWTRPRLTCQDETEPDQLPGEEEFPTSPSLAESQTSRAITTDFPEQTEAATTAENILTADYQVAVAGCVFLFVSVLLLSGLTWQRRCLTQPPESQGNGRAD
ncbi:interleukin-2 receptor subunit alpha [Carlito syrichta]|uniref:Interleukin-2 receptor subunit alpha n=1 Tax=Carlito syrichta TaxID=1868482 RepID=A0A3Q0EHV8_CARSF|nr:interleukin-2 receptor subunit alpha [Carlito syrichta]